MANNLYARKIKALLWAIDEDREEVDKILRDDFTMDELWQFDQELGRLHACIDDMIVEKRSIHRENTT